MQSKPVKDLEVGNLVLVTPAKSFMESHRLVTPSFGRKHERTFGARIVGVESSGFTHTYALEHIDKGALNGTVPMGEFKALEIDPDTTVCIAGTGWRHADYEKAQPQKKKEIPGFGYAKGSELVTGERLF